MHRRALLALLDRYQVRFPEDRDRAETIRRFVEGHADCFERSCREGHVTGSAWIASPDGEQAVLILHRKLSAWLQPGGHADGDPDPAAVACREAAEESGLESLRLIDWWRDDSGSPQPFDVDVHRIPARGDDPEHLHLDLRFLLVADPMEPPRASQESDQARWVARAEIAALNSEPSLLRMAERAASLLRGGCYIAGSGSFSFALVMTEPASHPALASFADVVAKTVEARADQIGQPPATDLIRAFAATLADTCSDAATARLSRELTRLVRLRRAQGHPLAAVLAELGRLQDAIFDQVVEQAGSMGAAVRAEDVLALTKRFLGSARDMTETTRALFRQDTIARSQSRAALLGAFARAVTHELRNRVNAARLSLSVYRLSPEERKGELLEVLDESLKQLEDSVADVSSVALAQARELPAEGRLQPIEEMLEELRDDLRDLTRAGKIELRIASPLPQIAVDAAKLRLALLYLVSNAIKHADRSKHARWVEIRVGSGVGRGEWRVDVADNGVGLPAIEHAIEQSVGADQAPAAPVVVRQEIGIVLATEAVRQLGGRLWIDANAAGQGTTASFTMRASPPRLDAGSSGGQSGRRPGSL